MSVVLGLNEFFHDTAAALAVDGRVVALIEQERLDRRKHATGFALLGPPPWEAIDWCLDRAGLRYADVDHIAVSYDADALRSLSVLRDLIGGNLQRTSILGTLRNRFRHHDPALNFLGGLTVGMARRKAFLHQLARRCKAPISAVNHHMAHAASAYFPSGKEDATVIVVDGMGDASPTTIWEGRGDKLTLRELYDDPRESLGVLYRTISLALGFSFMDAGKTMGLSAYGRHRPDFDAMLQVGDERYHIDWERIRWLQQEYARKDGELTEIHKDLAASVQHQLEEAGVVLARKGMARTGSRNVCLAGGVSLNCNMNSRIRLDTEAESVFVQPGAMDMGCALGAALVTAARLGDKPSREFSVYTGPSFSDREIEMALREKGLPFRRVEDPAREAADLLAERKVIGWFQGPMEFGPRALGARSILANPDRYETRDRVNRFKRREMWRPLAPAILEEKAGDWVEHPVRSPYMTFTFRYHPEQAKRVPAVVHTDGTARIQTVSSCDLPVYYDLIRHFEARTGIPIVMNTSYNDRGEPIVCTPAQAVRTFLRMELDALVAGPFIATVK
jgi:carbamoyltransferase